MVKLIATLLYIGYLPLMPGTWGSIAGVITYVLLRNNSFAYISITLLSVVTGFIVSRFVEKEFSSKDPREVVIDEFSSQLVVFLFIPYSIFNIILGFTLFRIFDIFKLPAIKKIERLPKGYGIMLDDLAVAIFVNLILQVKTFL